jgi:hypothetical protein
VQAFFTNQYLEAHPEDAVLINKLQDLIASQIPLLDLCIQIHRQRAPPSLMPFQQRLEECFAEMQNHVESKYGKKVIAAYINTNESVEYIQFSICVLSLLFCVPHNTGFYYCKANCTADFRFHRMVFQREMKILVRSVFYTIYTLLIRRATFEEVVSYI